MSWQKAFTVIDFETTGVEDEHRAVEIGLVRFENGAEVESCNFVLRPLERDGQTAPLPSEALAISGLTREEIESSPDFATAWSRADLDSMIIGAAMMAYNAPFDRRFLSKEMQRAGYSSSALAFGTEWIDPCLFVKAQKPWASKLTKACEERGIVIARAHRAVDDARAAGLLWLRLAKDDPWLRRDYDAVAKRQIELRPKVELDYRKYKARKAGQGTITGDLYVCDACFGTGWSENAGQAPQGWGKFDASPSLLAAWGLEGVVVCSMTCHRQFSLWASVVAS